VGALLFGRTKEQGLCCKCLASQDKRQESVTHYRVTMVTVPYPWKTTVQGVAPLLRSWWRQGTRKVGGRERVFGLLCDCGPQCLCNIFLQEPRSNLWREYSSIHAILSQLRGMSEPKSCKSWTTSGRENMSHQPHQPPLSGSQDAQK